MGACRRRPRWPGDSASVVVGPIRRTWSVALCIFALALTRVAAAHPASDGYLTLDFSPTTPTEIDGRWDVPLSDLDAIFAFARAEDGGILGAAVRAKQRDITARVFGHLFIHADGAPCSVSTRDLDFTDHEEGIYVLIPFTATCPDAPAVVDLDYTLFFDRPPPAPQHRGLVRVRDGPDERSIIFSSGFRHERFTRKTPAATIQLGSAIRSGILHIASGTDHLLFLLALLLPSVLRRNGAHWEPIGTFHDALIDVAKIVTAFTVAHSITLSLAALDVVRISPRIIEPAIAASVVVAAVQNLVRPSARWAGVRWQVAFALGLLHGFGFSSALADLGLTRRHLVATLFGFNLGVELGQLSFVAVFLPIAFAARRSRLYRPVGVIAGSVVIAVVASGWFVERVSSAAAPAHPAPSISACSAPTPARRCSVAG